MNTTKSKKKAAPLWRVLTAQREGARGIELSFFVAILLSIATGVITVITPLYFKALLDGFESGASRAELVGILYALTAVTALGWSARRGMFYALNRYEAYGMSNLINSSVRTLLYHSHTFFQNSFAGALVQKVRRFSGAFERLNDLLILSLIPTALTIIGSIVVVYFEEPLFAFVILGWITLFLVLNYGFAKFRLPYDTYRAEMDTETTATVADAISNHAAVSSFAAEERELAHVQAVTGKKARALWVSWELGNIFDGVQSLIMVGVTFLVFYIAIERWLEGAITLGTLALLQMYVIRLSDTMWELGRLLRNLYEAVADSSEMVAILDTPYEIVDAPGARTEQVTRGDVHFDAVTFAYPNGKRVLDTFTLTVPSGQKVALVGKSGSGKTTLTKLLTRLYDVSGGVIRVGGVPITEMTQQALRASIATVPQEPALFHRSILENIRYGRPDATDAEVVAAAKRAHCHEFIDQLPHKYETLVGERGVKLSGGERQRVAIARAILKNAPILVLDEATSALDSESEALIQDALNTLMEGKTVFVIAHRLSTIKAMDRILVIDHGVVIEDGAHDALIDKKGVYSALWSRQAGGFIADDSEKSPIDE